MAEEIICNMEAEEFMVKSQSFREELHGSDPTLDTHIIHSVFSVTKWSECYYLHHPALEALRDHPC